MLISNSIALSRWPKAGSTAAEAVLRASLPANHPWLEEGLHHAWKGGSTQSTRHLTTCRHPVPWMVSWFEHVLASPAHWPLLVALSGGRLKIRDIPTTSPTELLGLLIGPMLDPSSVSRKTWEMIGTPFFVPLDDAIWTALQENTLWGAAARLYVWEGPATHVVPQERLHEGLAALGYTPEREVPVFSRRSPQRQALLRVMAEDLIVIWPREQRIASALGYKRDHFHAPAWAFQKVDVLRAPTTWWSGPSTGRAR